MKISYRKHEESIMGYAHFNFDNGNEYLPTEYHFSMGSRFFNCLFFSQFIRECSSYYSVLPSDCDEFASVVLAKKYSGFHGRPYDVGEVIYECDSFRCSFEEGSSWNVRNYALVNGFERYLETYSYDRYNENYQNPELNQPHSESILTP